MRIGFDAKRAFQNNTGLGHYSRTLINSLCQFYPEHNYFLFAPKLTDRSNSFSKNNTTFITPGRFPYRFLKSAWRSYAMKKELLQQQVDVFHGLSHEIPFGIQRTGVKTVVTMHDLIFERYPGQYNPIDNWTYRRKFKNACKNADAIIAISKQTKDDLIELYSVPADKITVCYQSCDPIFASMVAAEKKEEIRKLYNLPDRYFLSVGSIIERKNLLTICKAINILKDSLQIPLVVIGNGGKYKQQVLQYIAQHNLQQLVLFLSDQPEAKQQQGFKNSAHFPAIYQMAEALIYPSMFEGFGIPILEALNSRLPVITSNVSCMPEAGGDAAAYIEPFDHVTLAAKMQAIANDQVLVQAMQEKGLQHAQNFTPAKTAAEVMKLYHTLRP